MSLRDYYQNTPLRANFLPIEWVLLPAFFELPIPLNVTSISEL